MALVVQITIFISFDVAVLLRLRVCSQVFITLVSYIPVRPPPRRTRSLRGHKRAASLMHVRLIGLPHGLTLARPWCRAGPRVCGTCQG